MKRFILVFSMLLISVLLTAQDVIVTKTSEKIEAKIIEVSNTEVKYKKTDFLDGPTFIIQISEISSIIYANGDVQAFNTPEVQFAENNTVVSTPTKTNNNTNFNQANNRKPVITFHPEPITRNRSFGLSIGYVSKQMANEDGDEMAWCSADMEDEKPKKSSPALRVGLTWSPEFKYGIGIQTGLFYEMSADSYKNEFYKVNASEHTLSIPLRVQYRYEFIPDLSAFFYTGPSFDVSVAYKMKMSGDGMEETYDPMKGEDAQYNRFNMLWGVGAGIRWKGLQLTLGGDWGLTNIHKEIDDIHLNKPFHISISYMF